MSLTDRRSPEGADSIPEVRRASWTMRLGCVLAALGSVGFAMVVVLRPEFTSREAFASPANVASSTAAAVGLALMVYALIHRDDIRPTWTSAVAGIGLMFAFAAAWFSGTGIVGLADALGEEAFDEIGSSGWITAMSLPKMLLCPLGFVALAFSGWRSQTLSSPACALLALGGLACILPPFPPGVLLVSLGLLLTERDLNRNFERKENS